MSTRSPLPADAILLAAPKTGDRYYKGMEQELISLCARLTAAAHPQDKFLIACNPPRAKQLKAAGVPQSSLYMSSLPDIWSRDICPVITPKGTFKFSYRPSYLSAATASSFDRDFERLLKARGVVWTSMKQLILDGGNYCHVGVDKAVVCDVVLKENSGLSREDLVQPLAAVTGSSSIAVVPTEEGDTLGHADGMVTWLSANVIAVNQFAEPFHSLVVGELKRVFPDVEIVLMPYNPTRKMWKGSADASGIYTNVLHTKHAAYVASYGSPDDLRAKEQLEAHLSREVVMVGASQASQLGGGLRCLAWHNRSPSNLPL